MEPKTLAIPVEGIKTNIAPVSIGPITILRLKKEIYTGIFKENVGSLAISMPFESSSNFDHYNAIEFLEDALSIIRLYISYRMNGLAALNIISRRKLWTYSKFYLIDSVEPSMSQETDLTPAGRIYEYRLMADHVDFFNENSMPEILHLLLKLHKKESISELDELIVKSATWAGLMMEDTFHRDRFLRGVTAIGTLFNKSNINGDGFKFRNLGSKLFCKFDAIFSPNEVEEYLRKIYKSRCEISHDGQMFGNDFGGALISADNLNLISYQTIITHICFNAIILWKSSTSTDDFYSKFL